LGTAHPEDLTSNISRGLLDWGQGAISRTLSIDYRLCSSAPYPKLAPFPSSLIDALAGYVYLLRNLGFKPQNVMVAGDSAGGNLALALVRYLRDNPELGLGMPGGLLLISPWCDPVGTHRGLASEQGRANAQSDYIKPRSNSPYSMGTYGLRSLLGDIAPEAASKNPYISPASLEIEPLAVNGMFAGFPPSYIVSGDAEMLIDEIRTLKRRMSNDMPEGDLVYDEVVDAVHDFIVFPHWVPERTSTFQRIVAWIRKL
jgi:acetyl esterase/lipase